MSRRSASVSSTAAAAMFSCKRCSFVVPGIGTIQGFWARSQASAIWAGVAFLRSSDASEQVDQRPVRLPGLRREAGDGVAEVGAVEGGVLVDLAGEVALAQRAEGNEADSELFERRDDLRFRFPPPQRVLALQGRDGLDRMRAADGLHACLGETEVPDLALLDQLLHRPRDVLDGHVRVDAVLIEQIDGVDVEPLERCLRDLLDVLGPAVQARLLPVRINWNPNLVAITTCSRIGARALPTSTSFVNGP